MGHASVGFYTGDAPAIPPAKTGTANLSQRYKDRTENYNTGTRRHIYQPIGALHSRVIKRGNT
eukprot:1190662-Prorocentrum_minimum.AAC.3